MTEPPARPPEELVDVVDGDDRVLRTVSRAVMRRERLLHRAVYIAVFSPGGRLLVHRRSDAKDVWPGWWDIAIGGVVAAGEAWDDAARRELAEEIGVVGEPEPFPGQIGTGSFEDASVAVLGRCYRVVTAGPFSFADGEVTEIEWVELGALQGLLTSRRFLPDSLALLLPLLLP